MNFWEKITGSDMTKEIKSFEVRVKKLPEDYQDAWEEIKSNLWQYSDFSGRNVILILEGVLGFFEEAVADGQKIEVVFGKDIKDFCIQLVGEEGAMSFRDKWRKQLNNKIAKKLEK